MEKSGCLDSGEGNEMDVLCREAKRLRTPEPTTPKSSPKKGRKFLFEKTNHLLAEESTQENFDTQPCASSKAASSEGAWHCNLCTYSNSSLLPYCEMCESPRGKKSKYTYAR